ncbi:MAG TPA: hypothetical protein VLB07_07555 [Woeseiaceae bacterium]|nr:hypothetical protein [Woeseiaceae bacterium]
MSGPERTRGPARLQLLIIAVLFLGPLILAALMYYGGLDLRPSGRSNHGLLLQPVMPLADDYPELQELSDGQWLLIYSHAEACDDECREALHTLRQSRLMLGNDMNRLARLFLHGNTPPDTVFLDEQHQGLRTLNNESLAQDLWSALPQDVPSNGFFLLDPLGNLVMYFGPDLGPREMVDDIKHLLDLSHIG